MYDLIIVGGGPAGLTSAIYACRAGLKTLVLEANACGGQIIVAADIENYPAAMHISGLDFAKRLEEQAEELGAEIEFDKVIAIEDKGETKLVRGEDNEYEAKTVIIATGTEPRKLALENEEELIGHGVSYCATCDGPLYKDKIVAVYGGGYSAVGEANYLSNIAKRVYIIHRRDEFRASAKMIEKLKAKDNVELILNSTITSLNADKNLKSITIESNGETKEIEVDALFVSIGRTPSTSAFKDIRTTEDGYIEGDQCRTNIPGVFVAGDCRVKDVRQLVTATADGAIAVNEVQKYLQK
ncbi:MAG: thioredoxin-disulfide reductase [Candidatus Saccharibacteria bacterium]|nr:thioredoxin-disulfide reductase [Candidatus Saccharibacteria bacterium]